MLSSQQSPFSNQLSAISSQQSAVSCRLRPPPRVKLFIMAASPDQSISQDPARLAQSEARTAHDINADDLMYHIQVTHVIKEIYIEYNQV